MISTAQDAQRESNRVAEYAPLYAAPRPTSNASWAVAGLALLAIGAATAYYFGPDFRRYLKIRSM